VSEETLFAEAILGKEAEDFLKSELGRYLIGRAEEIQQEALELLSTTHPWRRRRIQQLQNEVWRARSFQEWLAEMIMAGRQAEQVLDEQR
jgi:hypothetical protein